MEVSDVLLKHVPLCYIVQTLLLVRFMANAN
jgi:hypothetical protein